MSRPTLFPYQQYVLDRLTNIQSVLIGDDLGLGKAQPLTEPVLTPKGWRPIGEIEPGNELIGSDGNPTPVTDVYPQGIRPVYKVRFSDRTYVRCDLDHLWSVYTKNDKKRGNPNRTLSTRQLITHGLKYQSGTNKYFLPMVLPISFSHRDDSLILDPYLLGVLIGDGSMFEGTHLSTDHEIVKSLIFPEGAAFTLVKNTGYSGHYRLTGIIKSVRAAGLYRTHSYDKKIPDPYKWGSIDTRVSVLQGLLDTDGTTVSSRGMLTTTIEYGTTSRQLALDVNHIVRSLGGKTNITTKFPTFTYKDGTREGREFYRMTISVPSGIIPFRLARKLSKWIPRSKYEPTKTISDIIPDGVEECVCISVEAKDNLYVTRGFNLTHNTAEAISLDAERRKKFPNRISQTNGKTLVVTPLGVVKHWYREISRWSDLYAYPINPRKRQEFLDELEIGSFDIYICHWESLRLMPELRQQTWFHVIADECLVVNTTINTPQGPRKVQDIRVDDTVYGIDHRTNKVVATKVTQTFANRTNSQLYRVNNIIMTGNHPVYIDGYGYVRADALLDSMSPTGLRLAHDESTQTTTERNSGNDLRVVREQIRSRKIPSEDTEILWQILFQHLERPSIPQSGGLRSEGTEVYNLETETGNYFAEGLLVHNCHKIQSRKTKVTRSLKSIPTLFKTGLSGTPAYAKPDDLWSILNWLYPKVWTSYWDYFNRYILWVDYTGYKEIIGVQNEDELQSQIRGFYIRRTKEEVLDELPEKTFTKLPVELDPKQRRIYNQMRDAMLAWVGEHEDEPINASIVLTQLTRLQQFASAHADIDDNGRVTLIEPSSKIDAIMDILYDTNRQVVVFSQFAQLIRLLTDRLATKGITSGIYTGDVKSHKVREETIEKFKDGEIQVFAATYGAGGTGLDGLQVASTMIALDRPWVQPVFDQGVGRLDRYGQKNPVQIIETVANNTLESKRTQEIEKSWGWVKKLLGEGDED